MNDLSNRIVLTLPHRSGTDQEIYKFDNGYGASVITKRGGDKAIAVLAALDDTPPHRWTVIRVEPITSPQSPIALLKGPEVGYMLKQIEALPQRAA